MFIFIPWMRIFIYSISSMEMSSKLCEMACVIVQVVIDSLHSAKSNDDNNI